jgi:hypothetical protein
MRFPSRGKLRSERRRRKETILIHVLVWGIYERNSRGKPANGTDHPFDFFNRLKKEKNLKQLQGPYVR